MPLSTFKSSIEWYAKRLLRRAVGAMVYSQRVPPETIGWEKVRRVLIIRQHDPLGDVILTTPAFRAVIKALPQAQIDLLIRPELLAIFEKDPRFAHVMVYDKPKMRRSPGSALRFLQRLREGQYDAVVVFSASSFSVTSAWLAYLSGASVRIGYGGNTFGYEGFARSYYTTEIPMPDWPLHEVQKHLHLLGVVGIPSAGEHHEVRVSHGAVEYVKGLLKARGVDFSRPVICLHPGSGKPDHRWPVEHFARLNDALLAVQGWQTVLVVGPREGDVESAFLSETGQAPVVLPRLALDQVAALFQLSTVLVCNDTGVMHVAAGAGTPTVAMFGPYDPAHWNPLGPDHVALRAADRRYESISVDQAVEAVTRIVKARRETGRTR